MEARERKRNNGRYGKPREVLINSFDWLISLSFLSSSGEETSVWVTDQSLMWPTSWQFHNNGGGLASHKLLQHVTGCPHTLWHTLTWASSKRNKTMNDAPVCTLCQACTYTHTRRNLACGIKAILPHLINSEDRLSRPWHGVHFALLWQHLS